jgi:alkylation response protein AidB-like acyl-CoA dehydrogenase
MDLKFNEEQLELRAMAESFLLEHSSSEQVRAAMESDLGYDEKVWKQVAAELGWTAVHIPEEYGGLGLEYADLVALVEVMGGALFCSPFFSTVALGANALLAGGDDAQKQTWLPGIAAGTTRATLAFAEANGRSGVEGVEATFASDGDGFVLNGTKRYVVDGHIADLLIVAARTTGTTGDDGVGLFLVPGDAAGLTRTALTTIDQTRRLAEISLDDVRVPADASLGMPGEAAPILDKTLQLASIALAAEQVGGADRCLEMAVAYAKEREQFGRAIGSFQAIKHKCADMLVLVEAARSALYYAACVASDDTDELPAVASLAKAYCSDAYFQCAAENIQIHGGVGFTWEYDCHLHFKRAKSSESLLGDPPHHRELVAKAIGL